MKNIFIIILSVVLLASCGEKQATTDTKGVEVELTADQMKTELDKVDDSLKLEIDKSIKENGKIPELTYYEAINKHIAFYEAFPNDERAAQSLDKAQSFYTQLRVEDKAAKWRDTIIVNFPKYENRARVIESQAVAYDYDNYQPEMIKKYYTLLLDDYPNISAEKKEDIQYRLDNIDLNFEELIEKRMAEAE